MPVCRTCMGEYARQEALCPCCEQPLGRGVNLCHQCGAETGGKRLCPRCKSDVSVWEQEQVPLLTFILRRNLLALLPILGAIGMLLFFWPTRPESLHDPVMTIVAVLISLLVLIIVCMKRLFWRERWWAAQAYEANSPLLSLSLLMTVAFSTGIGFGALVFILHRVWKAPQPFWAQFLFGAVYVITYVAFTAGLTLYAVHDYVDDLDQRAPQPLFVNTEHLLRVVIETATKTLHVSNGGGSDQPQPSGESTRTHEVLEVVRNRQTGGVHVMFRECEQIIPSEGLTTTPPRWSEKIWSVDADRWGRVLSLSPGWQELDKKR